MITRVFDAHIHYGWIKEWIGGPSDRPNKLEDFARMREYLDKLVEKCKSLNITKVCLLGTLSYHKLGNTLVEEAFNKYPDLILGMARIDLDNDCPVDIDDYYKRGFRGFKVYGPLKNYDDQSYFPLYKKAEENGMPILFHTGVVGGPSDFLLKIPHWLSEGDKKNKMKDIKPEYRRPWGFSSARMQPLFLDSIAHAFPNLYIIGAHLGYSLYETACAVARSRPRVYFDLSGGSVVRRHILEKGLIKKEISIDKLLFASDKPISEIGNELKDWYNKLHALGLNDDELDKIFYRNAAEIFEIE